MDNQEKLHDVMTGTEWGCAAREIQVWGWDVEEEVEQFARDLLNQVVHGGCSVKDLRDGVRWANALDAEAVRLGIDITASNRDGTEMLARRIAHHAGRIALKSVGSRTKYLNTIVKSARISYTRKII